MKAISHQRLEQVSGGIFYVSFPDGTEEIIFECGLNLDEIAYGSLPEGAFN